MCRIRCWGLVRDRVYGLRVTGYGLRRRAPNNGHRVPRSVLRGGNDADAGQDDDVDAAVLAAAFGGVVGDDRVILGKTGGGEAGVNR